MVTPSISSESDFKSNCDTITPSQCRVLEDHQSSLSRRKGQSNSKQFNDRFAMVTPSKSFESDFKSNCDTITPSHCKVLEKHQSSLSQRNDQSNLNQFNDFIEDVLLEHESRVIEGQKTCQYDGEGYEHLEGAQQNSSELLPLRNIDKLRRETFKMKCSGNFEGVNVESMERLLRVIEAQMKAVCIHQYSIVNSERPGISNDLIVSGFVAASVSMILMTSPNIDKRLVSDDTIEACTNFLIHHFNHFIKPVYCPHLSKDEKSKIAPLKIVRIIPRMTEILVYYVDLISMVALQDRFLLQTTNMCIEILLLEETPKEMPHLWPLQRASLDFLQTVFSRNEIHRQLLTEELFGLLLKLPTTKRQLRTFKLSNDCRVQLATILVMLLIQSVVSFPLHETMVDGLSPEAGTGPAKATCKFFMTRFLVRCAKKDDEGMEFRRLLGNILDDLLQAMPLPEWPAAEFLLDALCRLLIADLPTMAQHSAIMAIDILSKIAIFAAGVQREQRENPICMPCGINFPELPHPQSGDIYFSCGCIVSDDSALALDCDRCHRWFHAACAGISSPEQAPEEWFCGDCLILRQIQKQYEVLAQRRFASGSSLMRLCAVTDVFSAEKVKTGSGHIFSECDVMRQLLLNNLSGKARSDSWYRQARLTHLAQWIEEYIAAGQEEIKNHFFDQWELHAGTIVDGSLGWTEVSLHAQPQARVARYLLAQRDLCSSHGLNFLLRHIMSLLAAPSSGLRCRVLKGLVLIVQADPILMGKDVVRRAMEERFHDESISVREAAVNLVGRYVLQGDDSGELFETYHKALMERLVDVGVSVRKSVVKTLRDCLLAFPCHERRAEICSALVERSSIVKEEDTIRDIIKDTFQELWFSESDKLEEIEGGSYSKVEDKCMVESSALQMIEVVMMVQSRNWLVTLIRGLIYGQGEGDKGKADNTKHRETAKKRSQKIVECVVEFMLRLEEGKLLMCRLSSAADQLLGSIALLHVFTSANPTFLVPHIDLLFSYLKGENSLSFTDESQLCLNVCDIVKQVVPLLPRPNAEVINNLTADLVKVAYRYGSTVVQSSIECLCCITTQVTHDSSSIDALLEKCYMYVYKYQYQNIEANSGAIKFLQRALIIIGHICQFHTFHSSAALDLELQHEENGLDEELKLPDLCRDTKMTNTLPKDGTLRVVYDMLRSYAAGTAHIYVSVSSDVKALIRSKALQGLASLLVGYPRFMLLAQKHGLVGGALDSSCENSPESLAQALRSWKHVLVSEEERIESGAARENMATAGITVAERVRGDQDSESSVVGGVLQMHVTTMMKLLHHSSPKVRNSSLALLNVMMRQGLLDPLEVAPHLVALQSDPNSQIRQESMRQIMVEDEKGRDIVQIRFFDGIFLAYAWTASNPIALLPPDDSLSEDRGACSVFSNIYTTCMQQNTITRNIMLRHMVAMFEERSSEKVHNNLLSAQQRLRENISHNEAYNYNSLSTPKSKQRRQSLISTRKEQMSNVEDRPLHLGLLRFLCITLAHLPYEKEEEPLLVIHYINKFVSLYGNECLLTFKRLVVQSGISLPDLDSDQDGELDVDVSQIGFATTEDRLKWKLQICSIAASLCMLLQLKRFLKGVYTLSDARCNGFSLSDNSGKGEHAVNIRERIAEINLSFLPALGSGQDLSIKDVVTVFEQLKMLLHDEDPVDMNISDPASIKSRKKRTTKQLTSSTKRGPKKVKVVTEDEAYPSPRKSKKRR